MGHADRDHAILSPSSAKQWINCTPSALLAEAAGSRTSVYAEEGTLAHEIAEYALTQYTEGLYDPIIDEALPIKDEHLKNPLFSIDQNIQYRYKLVIRLDFFKVTDNILRIHQRE